MSNEKQTNGWDQWSKHVLAELGRLDGGCVRIKQSIEGLRGDIANMHADLEVLKFKSGLWGAIGGAIPVLIGLAIIIIRGLLQ